MPWMVRHRMSNLTVWVWRTLKFHNEHAMPDNPGHPPQHLRLYACRYSKSRILLADQRDDGLSVHRGLGVIRA